MGACSHESTFVAVVDFAELVLLRGEDDDIVDIPTVDIRSGAAEIEAEILRFAGPVGHVEGEQILALGDAAMDGVFPDAFPSLAVLGDADADSHIEFALCGFEAVVELEVDEIVFFQFHQRSDDARGASEVVVGIHLHLAWLAARKRGVGDVPHRPVVAFHIPIFGEPRVVETFAEHHIALLGEERCGEQQG